MSAFCAEGGRSSFLQNPHKGFDAGVEDSSDAALDCLFPMTMYCTREKQAVKAELIKKIGF